MYIYTMNFSIYGFVSIAMAGCVNVVGVFV